MKGNAQSSVSTSTKARDTGKSLETRVSELAAAQSQFQANYAVAQSKTQSDCSVNSTRILEIIRNQEKSITSSTINSAGLIELKKEVMESLDAYSKLVKESLDAQSSKMDDIQRKVNEFADTVDEL